MFMNCRIVVVLDIVTLVNWSSLIGVTTVLYVTGSPGMFIVLCIATIFFWQVCFEDGSPLPMVILVKLHSNQMLTRYYLQGQQLYWFFQLQVLCTVFILFSSTMYVVVSHWPNCIYLSMGKFIWLATVRIIILQGTDNELRSSDKFQVIIWYFVCCMFGLSTAVLFCFHVYLFLYNKTTLGMIINISMPP